MGAVIATELATYVQRACRLQGIDVYYWTDSMIVLHWLRKNPQTLKLFVSNRVGTILLSSEAKQWRHVAGHQNPADLLSRGCTAEELKSNGIWWCGPEFLRLDMSCWQGTSHHTLTSKDKEADQIESKNSAMQTHICTRALPDDSMNVNGVVLPDRVSTFKKLLRITAYVFRFIKALKKGCKER